MLIAIDGSYCDSYRNEVRAGVIVADESGFYEPYQYKRKHITASSTFSEWFSFEKSLEIVNELIKKHELKKVTLISDYINIIELINRKEVFSCKEDVPYKNNQLKHYIYKLQNKLTHIKSSYLTRFKGDLKIEGKYTNSGLIDEFGVKLHKLAHLYAQVMLKDEKLNENKKRYKLNKTIPLKQKNVPNKNIEIKVKLECVTSGVRKWHLYENGKVLYVGKFRQVINKYNNVRIEFSLLIEQGRLNMDKRTRKLINKSFPKLLGEFKHG